MIKTEKYSIFKWVRQSLNWFCNSSCPKKKQLSIGNHKVNECAKKNQQRRRKSTKNEIILYIFKLHSTQSYQNHEANSWLVTLFHSFMENYIILFFFFFVQFYLVAEITFRTLEFLNTAFSHIIYWSRRMWERV